MHVTGILIVIVLIAGTVWFVRDRGSSGAVYGRPRIEQKPSGADALELLKERYARGELNQEEYLKIKKDLA